MTTVVNNPAPSGDSSSNSMGLVVGVIVLLIVVILLIFYGLPRLRGGAETGDGSQSGSSTDIKVDIPEKIDVNVNTDY